MRKLILAVTTAMIMVLALATVAMAADLFVGAWKLNYAKSSASGRDLPYKSQTLTCITHGNGQKVVADGVHPDGTHVHMAFQAQYDGKDYPLNHPGETIALRKVDENTLDVVIKKNGKVMLALRESVSKDGKTMTRTTQRKGEQGQDINVVQVFDRQ